MKQAKKWMAVVGFLIILVFLVPGVGYSWPAPDTGLTKCYDNEKEIPCPSPGEPFYGQDGCYTINPMSYTKLGAGGVELPGEALHVDEGGPWLMTRDNITGLIWELKSKSDFPPHNKTLHYIYNKYNWYDSNPETNGGESGTPGDGTDTEDFINAVNAENYGGYSDWRLPTYKELNSIADLSRKTGPCINTDYFPNTHPGSYWSSTTHIGYIIHAWKVTFSDCYDDTEPKWQAFLVRAVRGGQSESAFIDNGDGTVTDTATGLVWQQATAPDQYTWEQALAYCEGLNLGGRSDWRLPSRKELRSILDYSRSDPAIDTSYFPDTQKRSYYWSSTTYAEDMGYAWSVYTLHGYFHGYGGNKSQYYNHVRAVCGGSNDNIDENNPPVADAGTDQTVSEGDLVHLNGTASTDIDGDPLEYRWLQIGGPLEVVLNDYRTPQAHLTAPVVESNIFLTFSLTVTDSYGAIDTDTIVIQVVDYGAIQSMPWIPLLLLGD